jgi:cephalosporin hydroxylase
MSHKLKDITRYLTGNGTFEFFGLKLLQIPDALVKISTLLQTTRPAKIIEFGTGFGGLSILFHLYSKINKCKFITYDFQSIRKDILDGELMDFRNKDLLTPETIVEVEEEISETNGSVMLFCDALKCDEVNRYAPNLRLGDIVLMHDYCRDKDSIRFKEIAQIHNWTAPQEQYISRIEQSLIDNGIDVLFHDEFEDVYWFCGIKSK